MANSNTLFFVYRGTVNVNTYVARLDELGGRLKIIGAFPEREDAVRFALQQNFPTVVVERGFAMQGGDDNNLIALCEWEKAQCIGCGTIEPPQLTGEVSITGDAIVGSTLTIETSQLSGDGIISYQWARTNDDNGLVYETIPSAIANYYVVTAYDVGSKIMVRLTREGMAGELFSEPTEIVKEPVIQQKEQLTGSVSITGDIQIGETLTADTSQLGGSGAIKYQWGRSENISSAMTAITGATSNAYILTAEDANEYIGVMVGRENNEGLIFSDLVGPIL